MKFFNPFPQWTEFPKETNNFGRSQGFGANPQNYTWITYSPADLHWPNHPIDGHDGIDLSCHMGSIVKPMAAGRCVWTGMDSSGGIGVILNTVDPDDPTIIWEHIYWHLQVSYAKEGQSYSVDDTIGLADDTGHSTGTHLHVGVRQKSTIRQNTTAPRDDLQHVVNYYNGHLGYIDFTINPRNMTNVLLVKRGQEYGFYCPATRPEALVSEGLHYGITIPVKPDGTVDFAAVDGMVQGTLVDN